MPAAVVPLRGNDYVTLNIRVEQVIWKATKKNGALDFHLIFLYKPGWLCGLPALGYVLSQSHYGVG